MIHLGKSDELAQKSSAIASLKACSGYLIVGGVSKELIDSSGANSLIIVDDSLTKLSAWWASLFSTSTRRREWSPRLMPLLSEINSSSHGCASTIFEHGVQTIADGDDILLGSGT